MYLKEIISEAIEEYGIWMVPGMLAFGTHYRVQQAFPGGERLQARLKIAGNMGEGQRVCSMGLPVVSYIASGNVSALVWFVTGLTYVMSTASFVYTFNRLKPPKPPEKKSETAAQTAGAAVKS